MPTRRCRQANARVETMLVVKRTGGDVDWVDGRDIWYHEAAEAVDAIARRRR
jgi:acetyl-CoA synthetase